MLFTIARLRTTAFLCRESGVHVQAGWPTFACPYCNFLDSQLSLSLFLSRSFSLALSFSRAQRRFQKGKLDLWVGRRKSHFFAVISNLWV